MDNTLKFVMLMMIFFTLVNSGVFTYFHEGFNKKNHIVLMGDSMFDNKNYVYYNETVSKHLMEYHYNTINVAKDGAVISDLKKQLKKIPKKMQNKDNLLFISIGGNNILNAYSLKEDNFGDVTIIKDIFDHYKTIIDKIILTTKMSVILLDLYYPPKKEEYFKLIDWWNMYLKQFANERNLPILEVSEILNKGDNFVNDIEPSNKGGKILSKAIYEKAYNK
jgi:hypothetical protein